ncbi:MAG: fatty acid desaturase [Pseudomonadota bacterium]
MQTGASTRPFDRVRKRAIEWPTWIALIAMYAGWLAVLANYDVFGAWVCIPGALVLTFQSSLQHEALHGHPTRNALVNEALVFLPLGLFFPYRRFKETHLCHHNDTRLTDPYDDPETWYVADRDYETLSRPMRFVLRMNNSLAGRITLGPFLSVFGFTRSDIRSIRSGDRDVIGAWTRHVIGLTVVICILVYVGMPIWLYALGMAIPAVSLLSVRVFIEHRAAECPKQRSAIVETGWFWSLLFLNNNLHRVHHERPAVPWYKLPALWRAERDRFLADNGNYHLSGYGEVARRWLFKRREPVVHPLMRRDS